MKLAELSSRSGIPITSIKYYVREGLLESGRAITSRSSNYDEAHLVRLTLIRFLIRSLEMPVEKVKVILAKIDSDEPDFLQAMTRVHSALPPYVDTHELGADVTAATIDRARRALAGSGLGFNESLVYDNALLVQLGHALSVAEAAGIPQHPEHLASYVEAARIVARADLQLVPTDSPTNAIEFAVKGTVMYEPVLLALRRIAQMEVTLEMMQGSPPPRSGEENGDDAVTI